MAVAIEHHRVRPRGIGCEDTADDRPRLSDFLAKRVRVGESVVEVG